MFILTVCQLIRKSFLLFLFFAVQVGEELAATVLNVGENRSIPVALKLQDFRLVLDSFPNVPDQRRLPS